MIAARVFPWWLICILSACSLDVQLDPRTSSDQDAGADGGQPSDDAGSDAGDEEPPHWVPPVFMDDFERPDGDVAAPWVDAAQGTPFLWHGQLCVRRDEVVTVDLTPGRYGYARADVTNGGGFSWSLESAAGPVLTIQWHTGFGDLTQIATSSGEDIAKYAEREVSSVEVLVDHQRAAARVRVNRAAWVNLELAPEQLADVVRMRFGATLLEPEDVTPITVCFDNVYAGPREPGQDPFAASPPARIGAYTDDAMELCLFEQCAAEVLACPAQPANSFLTCSDGCECWNAYRTVLACFAASTGGTIEVCASEFFTDARPNIAALTQCAYEHCSLDISDKPLPLDNTWHGENSWGEQYSSVLALVNGPDALTVVDVNLVSGEVRADETLTLTAAELGADTSLQLYASWDASARMVQLTGAARPPRLFVNDMDALALGAPRPMRELSFGAPIRKVQRDGLLTWVDAANDAAGSPHTWTLLLGVWDWSVVHRRVHEAAGPTLVAAYVPPALVDAWQYYLLRSDDGLSLVAPELDADDVPLTTVTPEWQVVAMFGWSIAFQHPTTREVRLVSTSRYAEDELLPEAEFVDGYLVTSDSLWVTGDSRPTRLATLPADLVRGSEVPVTSDYKRVIYQRAAGWRLVDLDGNTLDAHEPAALEGAEVRPARVVAVRPWCGLFVSESEGKTVLDAYHVDAQNLLVVERLDVLDVPADQAQVVGQGHGVYAWLHGNAIHGYDCVSFEGHRVALTDPVLALADYTRPSRHRFYDAHDGPSEEWPNE